MKIILLSLILSLFIFESCDHDCWRVRDISNNSVKIVTTDKGFEVGDTITWFNIYFSEASSDTRYILLKKVRQ